ncbi:MAG: hypothetical protein WAS51_17515 [Ilumatobacteraceae bacterium]
MFVKGDPKINYHIAHIRDAKPGNRYVAQMTDRERADFANLVLLCKPHHDEVDKTNPRDYSVEDLEAWKRDRENDGVAELRGLDGLTEERLAEMLQDALGSATKAASASPGEITLDGTEQDFERQLAAALHDNDDIMIHRFLKEARKSWRTEIDTEGSWDEALAIANRVACLAALSIRWNRPETAILATDALEGMYADLLSEHGALKPKLVEPAHRLAAALANRALALIAIAFEESAWSLIPNVVARAPKNLHAAFSNWIHHAMISSSQAGSLVLPSQPGGTAKVGYLETTLLDIGPIECLNGDAPEIEALRTRLAGADALATLVAWHTAPQSGSNLDHDPYFPWHRAYEYDRYEYVLEHVLAEPELREQVYPRSDDDLAALLLNLETIGLQNLARYGGGYRYVAPSLQAFVEPMRRRLEHQELMRNVRTHAEIIGARLPLAHRGRNPTTVTYTDGSTREFEPDLVIYKGLMETGAVDHRSARQAEPPLPITKWTNDQLREWLRDNE